MVQALTSVHWKGIKGSTVHFINTQKELTTLIKIYFLWVLFLETGLTSPDWPRTCCVAGTAWSSARSCLSIATAGVTVCATKPGSQEFCSHLFSGNNIKSTYREEPCLYHHCKDVVFKLIFSVYLYSSKTPHLKSNHQGTLTPFISSINSLKGNFDMY